MPVLPLVVCGLLVGLFERLFMKLTGKFGRGFFLATSIIGTPVHELGHALMVYYIRSQNKRNEALGPREK